MKNYTCTNIASINIANDQIIYNATDIAISIGKYGCYGCSTTDVYYTGTESQWNSVAIGFGNYDLESVTIHYNYT